MIPQAVGLFFKGLPWGKIILALVVGAVLFAVGLYIRKAEQNAAKVVTLETDNSELTQANADLETEYKNRIEVLEDSFEKERKREKDYAENIRTLRAGPDGSCALNSPAIRESLRMRRERAASDKAR